MSRTKAGNTEASGTSPMYKIQAESRQDYLRAVYELTNMCGGGIRSYELAEYMQLSRASVCRAVGILKGMGLLTMDDTFLIDLTDCGTVEARQIYDKHRFFTDQLIIAGVDAGVAAEEACRLEHAISDESFLKLKQYWLSEKRGEGT